MRSLFLVPVLLLLLSAATARHHHHNNNNKQVTNVLSEFNIKPSATNDPTGLAELLVAAKQAQVALNNRRVRRRRSHVTGKVLEEFDEGDAVRFDLIAGEDLLSKSDGSLQYPTRSVSVAAFAVYRAFLRLRRFMYFQPHRLCYADGFTFMTGDNVKRGIKLGIKLAFLGIGDTVGNIGNATGGTQDLLESLETSDVFEESFSAAIEAGFMTVETLNNLAARGSLAGRRQPGTFQPINVFTDSVLSDYAEAWINFASHKQQNGKWDLKRIGETSEEIVGKGTYYTARVVEWVVNSPLTQSLSLAAVVSGIILVAIPEPGTTILGANLLMGARAVGFGTWTADAISGNLVASSKLTWITKLLIDYFLEERKSVVGKGCSILQESPCGDGSVCLRELLYEGKKGPRGGYIPGEDSSGLVGEYTYRGSCQKIPTVSDEIAIPSFHYSVANGMYCTLHRDCLSGYCHFVDPNIESSKAWAVFEKARAASPEEKVEIETKIGKMLVDSGVCARPVKKSKKQKPTKKCQEDEIFDPISLKHQFGACLRKDMVSGSFLGLRDPIAKRKINPTVGKEMFYGENYVLYGKLTSRKGDAKYYWNTFEGTLNYFNQIKEAPAPSKIEKEGRRDFPDISFSTSPWETATQVAFSKVLCVDKELNGDCKQYKFEKNPEDPKIRYDDFVAIVMPSIKTKSRETPLIPDVVDYRFLYQNGGIQTSIISAKKSLYPAANPYLNNVWKIKYGKVTPTEKYDHVISTNDGFALESMLFRGEFHRYESAGGVYGTDANTRATPEANRHRRFITYAFDLSIFGRTMPYDFVLSKVALEGHFDATWLERHERDAISKELPKQLVHINPTSPLAMA